MTRITVEGVTRRFGSTLAIDGVDLAAALRHEMRLEIRRICRQTKITTVYVTHDRSEALSMADTHAVTHRGRIAQVGSPREVYLRPDTRFVAGSLGETILLDATIVETARDLTMLATPAGRLTCSGSPPAGAVSGSRVTCSIRPEARRVVTPARPNPPNTCAGRRGDTVYPWVRPRDTMSNSTTELSWRS